MNTYKYFFFFFQAEDGIRDKLVTGVQTCALPISGKINATGKLPVTICPQFQYGDGIVIQRTNTNPAELMKEKLTVVDSIAEDAISRKVFPGCVVMAVKDGNIIYHKAFGKSSFNESQPVTLESIFDLASVTKISATTVAVM